MQFLDEIWGQGLLEMGLQQISEQVMVAEPITFIIQWQDKQVRPLECRQRRLTILAAAESFTQAGIQALQDRGPQQECLHFLRLVLQHFLHQVICHS